jgi:RNA polymerase sigma-70 factor (ECF subfamily)
VVQETLAEAAVRLDAYLRERPLPFYPWLRQLAQERLAAVRRQHITAQKRSVTREEADPGLPDHSALELVGRLFARNSSPSARLHRQELRDRVRSALATLSERNREMLVLKYLEHLSAKEIAEVLGVSEGVVNTRHVRALRQLRALLGPGFAEGGG